ncbi:PqqD family protein [Rhodopirellula islandica]|nr:PqqD family protein [Rhodopirellula islandica]
MYYAINSPALSHNAFDDETIVIHFATGNYFSLREMAERIWQRLENQPLTVSAIVDASEDAPPEAASEVEDFLKQLVKNDLVCELQDHASPESVASLGAWRTPAMEVFDDMKNMLLGDVIHDTDKEGWPQMAQDDQAAPGPR